MDNRAEDHFLDKMWTIWIGIYGAPECLYADGEGGLTTHNVKATLRRSGRTLKVRERAVSTPGLSTGGVHSPGCRCTSLSNNCSEKDLK